MKVVCIGYYDKFARFFIGIKKQLTTKHPQVQFRILNIYFSGYFYALLRFIPSSFISYRALTKSFLQRKKYKKILSEYSNYKGFSIEELTQNYYRQHNKTAIQLQALAYIDLLEKKIKNIDYLLLIGDLRLPFEIARKFAQQNNISTYYIEQGPYQTTFFDQKGVNANASVRFFNSSDETNLVEKEEFIQDFIQRKKNRKYNRSPIYRGIDYLLEALLNKTPFLPPDLKIDYKLFGNNNTSSLKNSTQTELVFDQTYLLICQVPFDVNMTHHSPFYSNHYQILLDVHKNLPEKSKLIIREHPVYKGKYSAKFYEYLETHENIFLDTNSGFDECLQAADVVIVNNSTVGLEAIEHKKTVITLANSYYDASGICLKLNKKEDLKELLKEALQYKINETKRINYLFHLFKNHLLEGYITDRNLPAAKTIANYLSKEFNS